MPTSSNRHSPVTDLERLLDQYPPDIVDLVMRVRQDILSILPDAREKVYLGWRDIGFHHPAAGYVCGIFPGEDNIKVGFEHGHLLHDPGQHLTGTGRQVRYLTASEWSMALSKLLNDFVSQGIELPKDRQHRPTSRARHAESRRQINI